MSKGEWENGWLCSLFLAGVVSARKGVQNSSWVVMSCLQNSAKAIHPMWELPLSALVAVTIYPSTVWLIPIRNLFLTVWELASPTENLAEGRNVVQSEATLVDAHLPF